MNVKMELNLTENWTLNNKNHGGLSRICALAIYGSHQITDNANKNVYQMTTTTRRITSY